MKFAVSLVFIGGDPTMIGKADILRLSVSERIQLVEDIWDSIAEVPDSIPLTDEQKAELDRRLDAYHKNPHAGSPWSVVRERFKSRT
jgi:putative addiction module component (TIGR02574 family)